jgi:hypothetical protein
MKAYATRSHPNVPHHHRETIVQRRESAAIDASPRLVAQAQWQSLVDDSPRQVDQRRRMQTLFARRVSPAGHSGPPVQRMTYVMNQIDGAFTSPEDRDTHRSYAVDANRTPILDTANAVARQAKTGAPADNRELHIYAHGNQAQVGRFSPDELKAHLVDECQINPKTKQTADSKTITTEPETTAVVLHSCLSGVKHPTKNIASPAEQLSASLTDHYKDTSRTKVAVVGFHSVTSTVNKQTVSPNPQFHNEIVKWEGVMADIRQKGSPSDNRQAEALYYGDPGSSYVVFEPNKARRKTRRKEKGQSYSFDEGGVGSMPQSKTANKDKDTLAALHSRVMKKT